MPAPSPTTIPVPSNMREEAHDFSESGQNSSHELPRQPTIPPVLQPSCVNDYTSYNTFTYNGHTLTWEEHSTGKHTFILISGFSAVRMSWTPTIEFLKAYGRCVTLDLPGHYPASTPPDYRSITQDELIDLEARAVQHICGNSPVTIIGHSTGGLVAIGVAARLRGQVQRVVTIGGVVWGELTGIIAMGQWLLRHNLYPAFWVIWKFTQLNSWTVMLGLMFYVHRWGAHWSNQLAWHVTRSSHIYYKQHSLVNLAIILRMLQSKETCDIRLISQSLNIPLLAIVGSDDPVVPTKQSLWLRDHVPCADVHIMDGVGHTPFIEHPAAYRDIMLRWLEQHSAE